MPEIVNKTEELKFDGTQGTNAKGSAVLGHLSGPCADIINPTRNGRKYSEELWEKVFKDPIVQEYFNCGGIFGELGHPADREETDMEKIAVCMPEPPKKNNKGQLEATFDILDTPNGRILKTLCDYGYKMGISSRGSGDTFTDFDGQESVDPDTYQFNAFDIVLLPAVQAARLNYNESLNRKSFNQALAESFNKATADEKKIMSETLNNLNIKMDESLLQDLQSAGNSFKQKYGKEAYDAYQKYATENPEVLNNLYGNDNIEKFLKQYNLQHESDDIDAEANHTAVDNNEAMVEELQNTLKRNAELEQKIMNLQEKLSVSYAKETKVAEEIGRYKKSVNKLSESANKVEALKSKAQKLEKELSEAKSQLSTSTQQIQKLQESAKRGLTAKKDLSESLREKDSTINQLNADVTKLTEQVKRLKAQAVRDNESLKESYAELKKDSELKKSEYSSKIEKSNKLVERYKQIATTAVNKYIESQATRLGVTANEIKNKLPESYAFDDIDAVCEDLQSYKLSMSRLPFHTLKENMTIKATPSKNETILPANNFDDEVDDTLLSLAGLK